MRTKWFYDEKKISTLVRILNRQERIIQELKCFIHESLEYIFETVERLDQDKVDFCLNLLPDHVLYSRFDGDKDSPFALYGGFLDYKRRVDVDDDNRLSEELKLEKERNEVLIEELHQTRMEFGISGEVQKIFVEKENGYKQ